MGRRSRRDGSLGKVFAEELDDDARSKVACGVSKTLFMINKGQYLWY